MRTSSHGGPGNNCAARPVRGACISQTALNAVLSSCHRQSDTSAASPPSVPKKTPIGRNTTVLDSWSLREDNQFELWYIPSASRRVSAARPSGSAIWPRLQHTRGRDDQASGHSQPCYHLQFPIQIPGAVIWAEGWLKVLCNKSKSFPGRCLFVASRCPWTCGSTTSVDVGSGPAQLRVVAKMYGRQRVSAGT